MDLIRTDLGVSIRRGGGERDLPIRLILGVGRNYAEHAKEMGAALPAQPLIFMKSPASACLSGDDIVIPKICQDREQVDFEGELAVIVGERARDVPERRAAEVILGYCVANDVSARWWQKEGSGGQFSRGKSFDSFCPLGPRVTPAAAVTDPQALTVRTIINGETMQEGSTADMIFPVAWLVAELSRGATLLPGTVILTGTPAGVGAARTPPRFLREGDTVEVTIRGEGGDLGTLRNSVRLER